MNFWRLRNARARLLRTDLNERLDSAATAIGPCNYETVIRSVILNDLANRVTGLLWTTWPYSQQTDMRWSFMAFPVPQKHSRTSNMKIVTMWTKYLHSKSNKFSRYAQRSKLLKVTSYSAKAKGKKFRSTINRVLNFRYQMARNFQPLFSYKEQKMEQSNKVYKEYIPRIKACKLLRDLSYSSEDISHHAWRSRSSLLPQGEGRV